MAKQMIFCSGAMGQPSWFGPLQQQLAMAQIQCVWPPKAPQYGWDPRWATWGEETIRQTLLDCGVAIWIIDKQGTPHPPFQRELQIARAMVKEGVLRSMLYIDVMRPSYVAHNAPEGVSESISLSIQSQPVALRSLLGPGQLPAFLRGRWLPLLAKSEENEEDLEEAPEEMPSPSERASEANSGEEFSEPQSD